MSKSKMNYNKLGFYAVIALFFGMQIYLFFFRDFEIRDPAPYINEIPIPMDSPNKVVEQEFKISGSLSRVDIMMGNYKSAIKDGVIRLSIFKGSECVYVKNYPADSVEDNRFYSFKIDTGNKTPISTDIFIMKLNFFRVNKTNFPMLEDQNRLAVWASAQPVYPFGSLYINGKKQEGSLTFRVYTHGTIWDKRNLWLFPVSRSDYKGFTLLLGFLLLLFMVNFLFYYFLKKLMTEPKKC